VIAQQFAQVCDCYPQAAFANRDARPGARNQFAMCQDLACRFGECDKDIQRAASDDHSLSVPEQEARRRDQPVGAKRNYAFRFHLTKLPKKVLDTKALFGSPSSPAICVRNDDDRYRLV
jgi:hypothetical protein